MSITLPPTRHVLVTGAANGIGAAVCRRFASEGHRITGVDLRGDALERVCHDIRVTSGAPTNSIVGDLADESFADRVMSDAWSRWGPVDIAVLAAGIYPAIDFLQLTTEAWDRVQAVNVRSVMQLTKALAELAIANGCRATIIHVSSGAAQRARPGAAAYSASKAALEMLTRSAALELGPFGIRVNAVSPGFVDVDSAVNPVTEAYAAAVSVNPLGRRGRPEDIASAVHWLAGEDAAWITGTVLRVDGGASAGAIALPEHWPGPTAYQMPSQSSGEARGR
jgi:NAD(P)-dependent dehydrogenase (short-subunit alcohol dehydrogenase family)